MHIQHLTPAVMHLLILFILSCPTYRKKTMAQRGNDTKHFRTRELKHLHGRKNTTAASASIVPFIKALKPNVKRMQVFHIGEPHWADF